MKLNSPRNTSNKLLEKQDKKHNNQTSRNKHTHLNRQWRANATDLPRTGPAVDWQKTTRQWLQWQL